MGTAPLSLDGRLRRCYPATGATPTVQPLLDDVGVVSAAPVTLAGVIHGATVGGLYGGGTVFRLNRGDLPIIDTDGDGLSNAWESTYGLDPFRADDIHGAAADPDGDGRTNAQEIADGTHPNGLVTRYFAEGAINAFFRTRIDLGNPGATEAVVLLRFQTDTGAVVSHPVVVPPTSHASVDPATIAGLASTSRSRPSSNPTRRSSRIARCRGTRPATAATPRPRVPAPSTTLVSRGGFDLGAASRCSTCCRTRRHRRSSRQSAICCRSASRRSSTTYVLPPLSRTTIPVDTRRRARRDRRFGGRSRRTAPIIVERAMYRSTPGKPSPPGTKRRASRRRPRAGSSPKAPPAPSSICFILFANPNAAAARSTVDYLLSDGDVLTKTYAVPANGRFTIWVDDEQIPAGSGFGRWQRRGVDGGARRQRSADHRRAHDVVARPAIDANFWTEAHNSPGATATGDAVGARRRRGRRAASAETSS